ncbi:MAG: hypothetical protein FWC80_06775, partial [Firmicutes bacterium]|nr:hypothetical protein [Bacillota bacterium]
GVYIGAHTSFVPQNIITTGLGEGLASTGTLSNGAIDRTFDAVLKLYNDAVNQQADKIIIFATEAVRAARNGNVFVSRVYDATGLEIDVISGEQEAQFGFFGAGQNIKGDYTVIDIGGASAEIASGSTSKLTYTKSLPLGVLRLLDRCGMNTDKITAYIKDNIGGYGDVPPVRKLISIGGTATILSAMLQKQKKQYNCKKAHGYKLTRKRLTKITKVIVANQDTLCEKFPFLPLRRAKVMLHGALLLDAILEHLGCKYVVASENGLSEGYLMEVKSKK